MKAGTGMLPTRPLDATVPLRNVPGELLHLQLPKGSPYKQNSELQTWGMEWTDHRALWAGAEENPNARVILGVTQALLSPPVPHPDLLCWQSLCQGRLLWSFPWRAEWQVQCRLHLPKPLWRLGWGRNSRWKSRACRILHFWCRTLPLSWGLWELTRVTVGSDSRHRLQLSYFCLQPSVYLGHSMTSALRAS